NAKKANAPKAAEAVPANNPYNPSVKLTAIEAPTNIKIMSNPYPQPKYQKTNRSGIEISVEKSCIFNVIKNTTAMTSCPINFCFDVNPKFRFIATIIKSSKNPIKPYPINTNSNNQNSYVMEKLKRRTLENMYVI